MTVTGADPHAAGCRVASLTQPAADWDAFVRARPDASVYFLSGWSRLAQEVFGHRAYFLEARDQAGVLCGVLPLVQQKSLLFGNFLTSVAFFNYGGALADTDSVALALMDRARTLATELGCSYLELRDVKERGGGWPARTDKVSMVLNLPAEFGKLSQQLGSKLRSQVKRVDRENPRTRVGGRELVDEFYAVFAHNMRDLGTPVYPRKFFAALVEKFPEYCTIVVVDRGEQPAAAAFLVIYGGRAEIPWAACMADAKPSGFNMKLYWEVLTYVVSRGCASFDFGRSTVDAGTYKFKKQWGAEPVQLHWYRWERNATPGSTPQAGRGRATEMLSRVWQKFPIGVANTLGPLVSPHLPW